MRFAQQVILTISLLFFSFYSFGQLTCFETFYGEDSTNDFLSNIESTDDGGYVVVGESQSTTKLGEFRIVKFDENGTIEFSKTLGTANSETAFAVTVLEDRYVIGGTTFVDGSKNRDCYLVTTDLQGNLLEETIFGGVGDDKIYDLIGLENGDIAVAASYENLDTGADFHVRRYTASLDLIAEIDYGNQNYEFPSFLVEDKNSGNILVGGTSYINGLLVNFSPQLDMVLWSYDGATSSHDSYFSGLDSSDDYYGIAVSKYIGAESFIGFLNKSTGEFDELIPLPTPDVGTYTPRKLKKKNNEIFLLISRSKTASERLMLKYDVVADTFSEEYELGDRPKDIAVQDEERFAVISAIPSDIYKADKVEEFDENAVENWSNEIGDLSEYSYQIGKQVIESELGMMYLGGEISRGSNERDNIVINKINQDGTEVWRREISIGAHHSFGGITNTADNGCIVAIQSNMTGNAVLFTNLVFQKYDSNGVLNWSNEFDISEYGSIGDGNLLINDNGDLYFSARAREPLPYGGILLLQLTESADVIQEKLITADDGYLGINKMMLTANQDLVISGSVYTGVINYAALMRVDPDGELIWETTLSIDPAIDEFNGIAEDTNGNLLVTNDHFDIRKLSSEGVLLDTFLYSLNEEFTAFKDICIAADSSFYVMDRFLKRNQTGIIFNPLGDNLIRVHHFDKDFNPIEMKAFGDGRGAYANRIFAHSQGGILIYGIAGQDNNKRGYLLGVNAAGITSTIDLQPQGHLKVYPTISKGNYTIQFNSPHTGKISLQIIDVSGKIVYDNIEEKNGINWEKNIQQPDLDAGLYFVNLKIGNYSWTQQVIKQ